MNTVQLRYAKRIVPVQYEYEELEVHFGVEADSNLVSRTQEMKDFVNNALYGKITPTLTSDKKGDSNVKENHTSEEKVSSEKTSSKKSSSKKSSEKEVVAAPVEEEMEAVESPYKATPAETIPSPEKATKGKKETAIVYDRENPDHRSTMSNFLVKLTGGKEWSKDKEKSKKASAELTGKPFLDKAGEILPSFQTLCKEKFGVTDEAL